jgi:hypothetical protein
MDLSKTGNFGMLTAFTNTLQSVPGLDLIERSSNAVMHKEFSFREERQSSLSK